jgi:hypothetical protein
MITELEDFLEAYAALERGVQRLMSRLCSETCGLCTACCCRADICEEALQSAFLAQLLHRQGLGEKDLDERYGWLEQNGCSLEYGRPPICYSYFCDQLLARLPDDETRHIMRVLGRLMDYIGDNALNELHLVEIMDLSDLTKMDFEGLGVRLEKAQQAYAVIEAFAASGRLTPEDLNVLDAIPMDEK